MRPLFNPKALHAALDAQRTARHMSWDEVAEAIHVELSTIREMEAREVLETDDILQMTRWLGLNIENFVGAGRGGGVGPNPGDWRSTGRLLRFDTKALHAAVDAQRRAQDLSWQGVSEAVGARRATAAMLMGLQKTARIDLYTMLSIVAWLGERTSRFTRLTAT